MIVHSQWFIMILFVLMFVFIIVLVIIAASRGSHDTCLTSECVETASRALKLFDNKVDPCVDFYSFACGKFLKEPILPGDTVKNSFSGVSDLLNKQLYTILKESETNKPEIRLLLRNIFIDCLTYKNASEEVKNVKWVLNSLGDWPMLVGNKWNEKNFDLQELMYRLIKLGIPCDVFFAFEIKVNVVKTSSYVLSAAFHKPKTLDAKSYQTISQIIFMLGATPSVLEADKREYEEAIKLLDKDFGVDGEDDFVRLDDLTNVTSIDWVPYMQRLFGFQNITITSKEMVYLSKKNLGAVLALVFKISKRIQANIIFIEIIHWMYKYLPGLHYTLEHKVPKSSECLSVVTKSLPLLINSLYVRRYFNKETKVQVENLVKDIRSEFLKILKTVDWLDDTTRTNAIEKLNNMNVCVGYPDELLDDEVLTKYYQPLKINDTNYLSLIMSIHVFDFNNKLKRLRQPVKNCYWVDTSQRVTIINAEYSVLNNGIRLPAAFFQDTIFDKDRPNYMNYATAGVVIGHEMTHGFDNNGKHFDKDGNLKNWWSNETSSTFKKKTECIINQYNEYKVSDVNMSVNGLLTLGENIADNGGLKESFLAYTNWVKKNGRERSLPGLNFTTTQMFWIAFAQFWCSHESAEYQQRQLLDVHAPARFRVIGTLSNIERFSTDFKCPTGSPMNPKTKCNIW